MKKDDLLTSLHMSLELLPLGLFTEDHAADLLVFAMTAKEGGRLCLNRTITVVALKPARFWRKCSFEFRRGKGGM